MKSSLLTVMLMSSVLVTSVAKAADETPPAKDTATKEAPAKTVQPAAEKEKDTASGKNDISDILNGMGYPELQVVPRASERLAIEAKNEDNNAAIVHWPMELAGLSTLVVAIAAKSNMQTNATPNQVSDANLISSIGTAVGVGWIAAGVVLGVQRPNRKGMNTINKYPGKDDHSSLLRERLAEEDLESEAETMRILDNVSVITNFGMDVASAWHANTTGQLIAGAGAIMSFLPWIFEDRSIVVYQKQLEYKKKIYVPLASASFHYEPLTKTYTPETLLTWRF